MGVRTPLLGFLVVAAACASAPPPPPPRPPRLPAPVVSSPAPDDVPESALCAAAVLVEPHSRRADAAAELVRAFFRAHAGGRIDPNLVDPQGHELSQQPLATELVCPAEVRVLETVPDRRVRIALTLRAGTDVVETHAWLSPEGRDRYRFEAASLDEIRQELQVLGVRRFLHEHPDVDRFQIVDVPFGNEFPAPGGTSPRRAYREESNRRLAFVRTASGATMCVLAARAGATSTRSECWRAVEPIDRVVVAGEPIVVDDLVQFRVVLVPPEPEARGRVLELRMPASERRTAGTVEVRPAPPGPAWMGRPLGGVALGTAPTARVGAWQSLPPMTDAPVWLGVASSVPWLRAEPVSAPPELSAMAVTVDADERRRWLAVRSHGSWAISDALEADDAAGERGMVSWDAVESGARLLATPATLVAWASDFHTSALSGAGAAHLVALRVDGERLREQGRLTLGAVRVWRSDAAPVDPVAERRRAAPPGPLHWVAWRLLHDVAPVGPPGCVRVTRTRADVAHVTYDFQALPGRPVVAFEPESLPASLRFGTLPDPRGDQTLGAAGFTRSACGGGDRKASP